MGIITIRSGSIFVKFEGSSHPRIYILYKLRKSGNKVIFISVSIREYMKLRPRELVTFNERKLTHKKFDDFNVHIQYNGCRFL